MKLKNLKENDVIHIRTNKEAKGISKLLAGNTLVIPGNYVVIKSLKIVDAFSSMPHPSEGYNIIPASKFLKKKSWKKEVFQEIARLDSELNELKRNKENTISFKKGDNTLHDENKFITQNELIKGSDTPKQDFEVGKWYKTLSNGAIFFPIRKETDIKYNGYGFDANGTWYEDTMWFIESPTEILATDEEVKEALVNEAKKRGFENTELMLFESYENRLVLHIEGFGVQEIFSNGIWANPEIMPNAISKETVDIDWSIPGQIVEHISSDTWFVINSGEHDDKYFIGTTLFHTNEIVNAGHYTKHPKCAFKLSDKKIELK